MNLDLRAILGKESVNKVPAVNRRSDNTLAPVTSPAALIPTRDKHTAQHKQLKLRVFGIKLGWLHGNEEFPFPMSNFLNNLFVFSAECARAATTPTKTLLAE